MCGNSRKEVMISTCIVVKLKESLFYSWQNKKIFILKNYEQYVVCKFFEGVAFMLNAIAADKKLCFFLFGK